MASHDCSSNANCSNSVGSFQCNCQSGYTGDGRACQGKCKLVLPLRQMDCYPSQMHNAISTHFDKCWNKPINHDLGRDNERDRQIHRYMYVNRNWKNKSRTGRQEENRTQRNITSDFEIYFHICFWFIFNWIFSIFVRCWRMHYGFSRLFSWCWLFKFCGIIPVRV